MALGGNVRDSTGVPDGPTLYHSHSEVKQIFVSPGTRFGPNRNAGAGLRLKAPKRTRRPLTGCRGKTRGRSHRRPLRARTPGTATPADVDTWRSERQSRSAHTGKRSIHDPTRSAVRSGTRRKDQLDDGPILSPVRSRLKHTRRMLPDKTSRTIGAHRAIAPLSVY